MKNAFQQRSHEDVVDLIAASPLALMVSTCSEGFHMTPLPMLADTDAEGSLVRLVGHMALRNPQVAVLQRHPRAHFLFLGPHGYVSPALLSDRTRAPTWNYAVARVEADVHFQPDNNDAALRRLVTRLEDGKPDAWSVEEMGARYEQLAGHVIAFDAEVREVEATFKLGQDERPDVFRDILAGLGSSELTRWMERFDQRED
jgi:transcriptional regulator